MAWADVSQLCRDDRHQRIDRGGQRQVGDQRQGDHGGHRGIPAGERTLAHQRSPVRAVGSAWRSGAKFGQSTNEFDWRTCPFNCPRRRCYSVGGEQIPKCEATHENLHSATMCCSGRAVPTVAFLHAFATVFVHTCHVRGRWRLTRANYGLS